MEGFVKLPRSILEWEWHSDPNTIAVYTTILLLAKWQPCRQNGYELNRGQLLITVAKLGEYCGLSVQQTKTALERLKSTNKITIKGTNKFSIITLNNYDCEPENNQQNNEQITSKQLTTQLTNNQPTLLYKEDKNIRNPETAASAAEGGGFEKALKKRSTSGYEESFERFWSCYPRKTAKQNALKAWLKLKPDEALVNGILSALERFKKTEQWLRDNGRYIPYPATWLEDRRWEDEVCSPPQNNADKSDKPPKHSSGIDTADVMERIKARYHRAVDSGGDT